MAAALAVYGVLLAVAAAAVWRRPLAALYVFLVGLAAHNLVMALLWGAGVRGNSLEQSMSHYLIEQLRGIQNVSVRHCTEVIEADGTEHLEQLTLRDSKPMEEALVNLTIKNLSNLTPHPWYSAYHYSHPTRTERIVAIRQCAA